MASDTFIQTSAAKAGAAMDQARTRLQAQRASLASAIAHSGPARSARALLARYPAIEAWWRSIDHGLMALAFALLMIGVLLSFASSPSAVEGNQSPWYYTIRQSMFAVISGGTVLVLSMLSPTMGRRLANILVVVSLVLLAAILVGLGYEAKGAARWIKFGPLMLQPVEILKPAAVVTVAWFFSKRIEDPSFPAPQATLVLLGLSVAMLLLQPDVGQSILLTVTVLTVFFVAGVSWVWITGLLGTSVIGLVGLYHLVSHFRERITKYMSANDDDNEQLQRALDAIASGRFLGVGPGEGERKFHLPDAHTDFIYSLASEEYGMLASLGLIVLFAALIVGGLVRASKLRDPFCYLAATGLFILVGYQAGINFSVNLDVSPTKGMTLPFISYGGSSLLGTGLSIGLALAFTRRKPGDRLKDW